VWIRSGEIFREIEIVWKIFQGRRVFFHEKNSPCRNYVGKILHGVIFHLSNFPLGIGDFQEQFFTEGKVIFGVP
jgi:hypothetical protein